MLLSKITANRGGLKAVFINPAVLINPPLVAVMSLLAALVGLRFVFLSADFPVGISSLGMTYTDEGWWARNAIAFIREGQWYIDDGYNTVFNLPVLPLIQSVWFKIFGISLASARSITVVSVVGVSLLVYALARLAEQQYHSPELNHSNSSAAQFAGKSGLAWLAPFIVLSSYPVFVFSRLALLELPMMVMILISLWLAVTAEPAVSSSDDLISSTASADPMGSTASPGLANLTKQTKIIGSAIFLALAALVKTSALFALPTILVMLYLAPGKRSQKIRTILLWLLVFSTITGLYTYIYSHGRWALSYGHFSGYNVDGKLHKGLLSLVKGPLRVLKYSFVLFPLMMTSLVIALVTLTRAKRYRTHKAFQISLLWSLSVLAAFSTSSYAAPRYFLVWVVPFALALPLALQCCWHWANTQRKHLLLGLFLVSTVLSLCKISVYLATPKFTLVNMAEKVATVIAADRAKNPAQSPIVMGHFADTLSLVEDIKTINDRMGYRELYRRFEIFNPGYYVSTGEVEPFITATMDNYYARELIQTFDVYDNYDYGVPVYFYRLYPYDWWKPEQAGEAE